MLFEGFQQSCRKAEIACFEFGRIFRSVYPRKVENEIGSCTVSVKLFLRPVDVVFVNLTDLQVRARAVLPVADILQIFAKIPTDKALGSGDKYVYISFLQTVLLTTPV